MGTQRPGWKGHWRVTPELKGRESQEDRDGRPPQGSPPTPRGPHLVVGQVQVIEASQMLKRLLWEPFKGQVRALDEGNTAGEQANHPSARQLPPFPVSSSLHPVLHSLSSSRGPSIEASS